MCCSSLHASPASGLLSGVRHLLGQTNVRRLPLGSDFTTVGVRFNRPNGLTCLHPGCTTQVTALLHDLKTGPFLASYGALCSNHHTGTMSRLRDTVRGKFGPVSTRYRIVVNSKLGKASCHRVPLGKRCYPTPGVNATVTSTSVMVDVGRFGKRRRTNFNNTLGGLNVKYTDMNKGLRLRYTSRPGISMRDYVNYGVYIGRYTRSTIRLGADHGTRVSCAGYMNYKRYMTLYRRSNTIVKTRSASRHLGCGVTRCTLTIIVNGPRFRVDFVVGMSPRYSY